MILLIWTLVFIAAVLLFFRQKYSRFSDYGVRHLKPFIPMGNLMRTTLRLEHLTETVTKTCNAFPEDRFVGHYEFINPVVVLKDLDLIRKIALKDFDHFVDHRVFISENNDALFGRNLFSLKGPEWRDMRSTLSPAFTSSKIRLMVPFMTEVGDQMYQVLKQKIIASEAGYIDIDTRDLTTRYANDVIATCAFGLKVNSHAEEENEFYVKGRAASNFSFVQLMKFFGFTAFPTLMNFFRMSLFPQSAKDFFRSLVTSVMKNREENHILRPDMIHLLMEAKKGKLIHDDKAQSEDAGFATVEESAVGRTKVDRVWSDDDLIAQAVLFFIAGFDTVSTAMTFMLYELAVNPDVQEKLVKEIREVDAKNGGKFDFNSIQNMVYMDMVVSEVLRMWTPVAALDRLCVKDYNLGRANDNATKDFIVKKGEGVWIPAWSIHRSPEYFPNPNKFDPERFSKENVEKIKPFTYMPFGLGPRNCIGSRFALCEVKVMAYQLLKEMEVSPSDQTGIPVVLSTDTFNLRMKGGHWLRLKTRS